jgi:cytochrome c556
MTRLDEKGGGVVKYPTKHKMLTAVLICGSIAISIGAPAQDKETIIKNREVLMKGLGTDLGSVKAYIDGKGDQVQAEAGAASLTPSIRKIPDAFPVGTGGPDAEGKYATKPVIWTDWDKFLDAQKTAAEKAEVLLVAVKSGDKAKIEAAFGDLGKNGCGACHQTFREKLKD